jgi:putative spermidine/putrescine transport system permease protein
MGGGAALRHGTAALLLAPALIVLIAFFALPFLTMAMMSVLTGNPLVALNVGLTTRHWDRLLGDIYYGEVLWATLRLGAEVTVIALLLGYPLAFALARVRGRTARTLLLMAVLAPMMTGLVVRTYAWLAVFANRGLINGTLTGLGAIAEPIGFIGTEGAVVAGLVHIYVPFMILTLTGVIARIDVRLEEAARGLGASRLRTFLSVTLPLSMPGIAAGSLLVFALAISAYVTPIVLGGSTILTLPILVYQQVSGTFNLGFAATLGVVLLAVALVLMAAYNRALARIGR